MALALELNQLDRGSYEEFFTNCEKQTKENIVVCFAYFVKRFKKKTEKFKNRFGLKKFESNNSSLLFSSINSSFMKNEAKGHIQDFSHGSFTAETPMLLQQVDYLIEKQQLSQSIMDQQKATNDILMKEICILKTNNSTLQESLLKCKTKKVDSVTSLHHDEIHIKEQKKKVVVLSSQIQAQKDANVVTSKSFGEIEQELRKQNEKNSSLRESLSNKYDTILAKSREIEKLKETITQKSIENNNYKNEIQKQNKNNIELKKNFEKKFHSLQNSETKINDFKQKFQETSNKLEELKSYNNECEQNMKQKDQLIEKINNELDIIKCEKSMISNVKNQQHGVFVEKKNIELLKYRAMNDEQYIQNQKQTDLQSRTINELDMHMDTLKELEIYRKSGDLKDLKLVSLEKAIDEIEDLYLEIKKNNETLQETVDVLKNENKYMQGLFEQQKKMVLEYSQKNLILERLNIESENRNCTLQLEKENIKKNCSQLQKENKYLSENYDKNEKSHKEVEDKFFNLSQKHNQLQDQLDSTNSNELIKYEKVRDLEDEISWLHSEHEKNKQIITLNSFLQMLVIFFMHYMSFVSIREDKSLVRKKKDFFN